MKINYTSHPKIFLLILGLIFMQLYYSTTRPKFRVKSKALTLMLGKTLVWLNKMCINKKNPYDTDHISVCVCTFKRPEMLNRLLSTLEKQESGGSFTFSIVIVDNDNKLSAKKTVQSFLQRSTLEIKYLSEKEQNISLARNKAIDNADGNLVAFIDDDEFPVSTWLLNLYSTYYKYDADGVLGPVKPFFDDKPPDWLLKGKFAERPTYPTGRVMHWWETRTGNVLIGKHLIKRNEDKFSKEFGRTGGEDIDFFRKQTIKGNKFIWCNNAIVYEIVPIQRWNKNYYYKRNFRVGGITGKRIIKSGYNRIIVYIKILIILLLNISLISLIGFINEHHAVRVICKICYCTGWFSGFFGVPILRDKDE